MDRPAQKNCAGRLTFGILIMDTGMSLLLFPLPVVRIHFAFPVG